MIKKFINRLLGKGPTPEVTPDAPTAAPPEPVIPLGVRTEVPASVHGINPELLDANAVRVVKTLKDAGFEAYIVGGAVRDLLVGMRPKDFDVATDATPEQVKALFRRAFIIGRRFRLVHVVFGRGREHEAIEVSTFRAYLDAAAADAAPANDNLARKSGQGESADKKHVVDASGRVLRCIAMYDATLDLMVPVEDIASAGHSAYLEALLRDDCVVATDARADPATVCFLHDYLEPLNIHSLLDVCFSVNGVPFGIFSCEQIGAPVAWNLRQLQMLRQIGSRASLTLMRAATATIDTAPGALWEGSGTGRLPGPPPKAAADGANDHPIDAPNG